ncbi:imidazole glycerol phosphate synthase subunit HisH [Thalassospira povalilytica]|uniref:imidazole glycerol phosphate synthase subunit HisH n=1 Tax=Thalassospira povalilytica TaxID=732237 RepID=UPI003AA8E833
MSAKSVQILDYGIGNLFSVCRAIEKVGGTPELISKPDQVVEASKLIIPGVGAFERCVSRLKEFNLISSIMDYAQSGKPLLGICVGMQLLMDQSSEFGTHAGLGLIPGTVGRIPDIDINGEKQKVPHVGWAKLDLKVDVEGLGGQLFDGQLKNAHMYFVHSYHAIPLRTDDELVTVDYNGVSVSAAVGRQNVVGVQFHPEKSGEAGLLLLRNFVEVTDR